MLRCLFLALLLPGLAAAGEVLLEDDRGAELHLAEPAERVVTLAPHLAELLFEIGAGDRLVGTVEWSNHPPAARDVPRIGNAYQFDMERIIAARPDVILAWDGGTPDATIERLRRLGIPVAVLAPSDLASIPRHIEWLGRMVGRTEQAARQAATFRHELDELRSEYAGADRIKAFYQISAQPLFTIGGGHVISELLESCGGENIFSDLSAAAHAVSGEAVIARDPDVIVAGEYENGSEDDVNAWTRWPQMTAVQAGNLFAIRVDRVARPTSGMLQGGRELCAALDRARRNLRNAAE